MKQLLDRLTVKHVHDGHVVCTGVFETADGKGMHSLLEPVIHLTDLQPKQTPKVGDVILRYDDRSLEHQPATP